MRIPIDLPDKEKFLFRLLLTLQDKNALCWSWVTVRNVLWLPQTKRWLRDFGAGRELPLPREDRLKQVDSILKTYMCPPVRSSYDRWYLDQICRIRRFLDGAR